MEIKEAIYSIKKSFRSRRSFYGLSSFWSSLAGLLTELGVTNPKPVTLHYDNQNAILIARNPVHYERTKRIEIDVHFTRDKILEGLLQLSYISKASQLTDVFAKVLLSNSF